MYTVVKHGNKSQSSAGEKYANSQTIRLYLLASCKTLTIARLK